MKTHQGRSKTPKHLTHAENLIRRLHVDILDIDLRDQVTVLLKSLLNLAKVAANGDDGDKEGLELKLLAIRTLSQCEPAKNRSTQKI